MRLLGEWEGKEERGGWLQTVRPSVTIKSVPGHPSPHPNPARMHTPEEACGSWRQEADEPNRFNYISSGAPLPAGRLKHTSSCWGANA